MNRLCARCKQPYHAHMHEYRRPESWVRHWCPRTKPPQWWEQGVAFYLAIVGGIGLMLLGMLIIMHLPHPWAEILGGVGVLGIYLAAASRPGEFKANRP